MDFYTIENAPKPKKLKCKILVWALSGFIYLSPFILAFLGVVYYDWFVGFFALCFGFIAIGIFQSKLRQLSVPADQAETNFSIYELSRWFVLRYMLCEADVE